MKESKLVDMQRSVEALKRVTQQVLNELAHLRELGVGTLELVKLMDGYDKALEKLKTDLVNKNGNRKYSKYKNNCFEYNIGLGRGFSVLQIIEKVEEIVGKNCPYKVIDRKEGDPAILIASAEKITKELGWKPKFNSIDEIIIHSYNWIKHSNNL